MLPKKLKILKTEISERGLAFGLQRLLGYIFSPFFNKIQQNRLLLELFYGLLPRLGIAGGIARLNLAMPRSELIEAVRAFWYKNVPGAFDLDGQKITRQDIFVFGGPNPELTCSVCQKSEWLSRVNQKNLFERHSCHQSPKTESICQKQGSDLWTHWHQNFNFALGRDASLPAPKMLYLDPNYRKNFLERHCDIWQLLTQRRLAFCCQVEIAKSPFGIDWSKYDCLFMVNNGQNLKFKKPKIPLIMYGHDFWPLEKKGFQWVIGWSEPEVFMSSALQGWQTHYLFPAKTKFVFYPFFDSLFFSRPNLAEKQLDLLAVGATSAALYQPRYIVYRQIEQLNQSKRYRIEIFKTAGSSNVFREGPTIKKDPETGREMRFLNKWSEYLGSSRYVIFGRTKFPFVTGKHYESLGSGTVPIFPECSDFKHLGIKAFEHYIPLSVVEGSNEKLAELLDNYDRYRPIAANAVKWYKENSDRLIFDDFEEAIRHITNYKYPKRII